LDIKASRKSEIAPIDDLVGIYSTKCSFETKSRNAA
jgi:hypothetical protein